MKLEIIIAILCKDHRFQCLERDGDLIHLQMFIIIIANICMHVDMKCVNRVAYYFRTCSNDCLHQMIQNAFTVLHIYAWIVLHRCGPKSIDSVCCPGEATWSSVSCTGYVKFLIPSLLSIMAKVDIGRSLDFTIIKLTLNKHGRNPPPLCTSLLSRYQEVIGIQQEYQQYYH